MMRGMPEPQPTVVTPRAPSEPTRPPQGHGASQAYGRTEGTDRYRGGWRRRAADFRPGRTVARLPPWAVRLAAWTLAVADLALLPHSSVAFVGFFVVFPMLWMVHETRRGGVVATLVFATGVGVVETATRDLMAGLSNGVVPAAFSVVMGLWMWHVYEAKSEVALLLAQREEALSALARTQAELAATERAAGVAAERARWAHDIHDTLAQGFVSVITLTQAAQAEVERVAQVDGGQAVQVPVMPGAATMPAPSHRLVPTRDEASVRTVVLAHLASVERVARDNLAEARALVAGDGPPALQGTSLAGALERLAADQESHGGLRPALSLGIPPGLSPATEVVVLRTVQEALTNVRRHARARHVGVDVHPEAISTGSSAGPGRPDHPADPGSSGAPDSPAHSGTPGDAELVITVVDDGVGTGGAPEGTGLSGMRARVEAMGGTLTVDPLGSPGQAGRHGTVVEARMPL